METMKRIISMLEHSLTEILNYGIYPHNIRDESYNWIVNNTRIYNLDILKCLTAS